jgi:hypothetical protein
MGSKSRKFSREANAYRWWHSDIARYVGVGSATVADRRAEEGLKAIA